LAPKKMAKGKVALRKGSKPAVTKSKPGGGPDTYGPL